MSDKFKLDFFPRGEEKTVGGGYIIGSVIPNCDRAGVSRKSFDDQGSVDRLRAEGYGRSCSCDNSLT